MGKVKNGGEYESNAVLVRLTADQARAIDGFATVEAGPLNLRPSRSAIVLALLELGIKTATQAKGRSR